jgi:hypothetical protein
MRSSPQAPIATNASRRYFKPVRLRVVVSAVLQFFQPEPPRAPGATFRTRIQMLPIDAASAMTTAWLVIDATIRADTPAWSKPQLHRQRPWATTASPPLRARSRCCGGALVFAHCDTPQLESAAAPGRRKEEGERRRLRAVHLSSLAAHEQYRQDFGHDADFIAADRIREQSGGVLRYERSLLRPVLEGN